MHHVESPPRDATTLRCTAAWLLRLGGDWGEGAGWQHTNPISFTLLTSSALLRQAAGHVSLLVRPVFFTQGHLLPCCSHLVACCRLLDTMRSLVSPVFFSTMEDGTVVQGLGALPADRWARAACFRAKLWKCCWVGPCCTPTGCVPSQLLCGGDSAGHVTLMQAACLWSLGGS